MIHPDLLTSGGILETKKIGDAAQDHGVAMAIHMAESPIAAMAAAHVGVAPIVQDGFITVPDKPGLGIDDINDAVVREHLPDGVTGIWEPTEHWDDETSWDRTWS